MFNKMFNIMSKKIEQYSIEEFAHLPVKEQAKYSNLQDTMKESPDKITQHMELINHNDVSGLRTISHIHVANYAYISLHHPQHRIKDKSEKILSTIKSFFKKTS